MADKQAPELRFKGFNDAWELCKFSEGFEFPVSTNSLSRAQLNYDSGEIKSVHYGDILVNYGSILNVKTDRIPFITNGILGQYTQNLLKNRDLIFADAAEDETVGKCVEVNNISDEYIVAGLHTIVARERERKATFFLGHYMNSNSYQKQLLRLMQGSKVSSISKSNLKNTIIATPKNIEEQEKIGFLFEQLDNAITLHHRKLESLRNLKNAYLQQMFPSDTEKVPKLRFANFNKEWEQRKLGNVGKIVTGSTPSTLDKTNYKGSYLFISPADIQANRYVDNTITTLSEKGFRKGRILTEGASLFVSIGSTIGKVAQIRQEAVTNQQINAVVPFEYYDNDFVFSSLIKESKKIRLLSATQAVPIINKTTFSNFDIYISENVNEQTLIGTFFNKLDFAIALHQQKLDQLKKLKSAYLQKMFT